MNYIIRILTLALVLCAAGACAKKTQPPVKVSSGKAYVPATR
jgi:hypothetical protein